MHDLLSDRRLLLPALATAVIIAIGSVLVVLLTGDPSSSSSSSASASGGGTPPAPASPAPAGSGTTRNVSVDIANFAYKPKTVTVAKGGKVTWKNSDSSNHTATVSDALDTGNLQQGDAKAITFAKAGTYSYVCQYHPFMTGKVVVR